LETARTTPSTMPESATAVLFAIAEQVLCKLLLPVRSRAVVYMF
jgi:hypothetical protein